MDLVSLYKRRQPIELVGFVKIHIIQLASATNFGTALKLSSALLDAQRFCLIAVNTKPWSARISAGAAPPNNSKKRSSLAQAILPSRAGKNLV